MFTQASQPRLSQRSPDAGRWIVPEAYIEESSAATPDVWSDASSWFETQGCFMSSMGSIVSFVFAAKRTGGSSGNIYRLSFPFREDTITTPQTVGEMAIVTVLSEDPFERQWAIYPLVGTPEGRLESLQPYDNMWPETSVGDIVHIRGTWFI